MDSILHDAVLDQLFANTNALNDNGAHVYLPVLSCSFGLCVGARWMDSAWFIKILL